MGCLPQAIVWDLDGTLIDSAPDLCRALNTVLVESNCEALAVESVRTMIGNGVAKLVERGFRASGRPLSDAELAPVVEQFMVHYSADPTAHTRLYPGVAEALEKLAKAGVKQGLCTNKPEAVTRLILQQLNIDQYFSAVVGGDTTDARKPDPRPLQYCIDTLGVAVSDTIMIGDSAVDAGSARALRVKIGLVAHGYRHTNLAEIDADFLVEDIASVPEILAAQMEQGSALAC
ncbi:MAG: phosphoglycolate phosphatase [Gammaproteobacteria bacterium]|nr:phosphoglycolate phosphatase [Gammaproteobacteria bacterium]